MGKKMIVLRGKARLETVGYNLYLSETFYFEIKLLSL